MTNDARVAILLCAALGALAGTGGVAPAQPMPTPTPAPCARPNVMATVLHAAPVATPPMAAQQGIEGNVEVIVSLDAESHVVGTRIRTSPSAILNAAAIAATRESTFQTEIRQCRPIAADYIYVVEFELGARFTTTSTGERIVTVTGHGTVQRAPDSARIIATVVTHDDTAAGATMKNDAVFAALKAKLAPLGIGDGDITGTSSVRPLPPPGAAVSQRMLAEMAGAAFTSMRPVEITVGTVANAVPVAAAAAPLASVTVRGIRYELTDRTAAYREAMSLALQDCESGAQDAVNMHRLRLGPLKQVVVPPPTNTSRYPAVFVALQFAAVIGDFTGPKATVPEIPVRATATATYAVLP